MLENRDRGYSFGIFLRRNMKIYFFFTILNGLALAFFVYWQIWWEFYLCLGLVAGVFLRDIAWFLALRRNWPFRLKVTDWEMVQRLADGTPKEPVKSN